MSTRLNGEVVVLPGLGSDAYPQLNTALGAVGLAVHAIAPQWGSDFSRTLANVAEQVDALRVSNEAVVVGHSLGAVLAMGEVARRTYGGLVLCSPSPTGQSLKDGPPEVIQADIDAIGKDTFYNLCTVEVDGWLRSVKIPQGQARVLLETTNSVMPIMLGRATNAARLLGVPLERVEATHHLDDEPNYVAAAARAALELYSR